MFGPPQDEPGECNARLYIGDDYGDNCATIRCRLPVGHEGPHREEFDHGTDEKPNHIVVTWETDERNEGENEA